MNPVERNIYIDDIDMHYNIGLSPEEYGTAVEALQTNDLRVLRELILSSDKYINTLNRTLQTTKDQFYDENSDEYKEERKLLHQHIVRRETQNIPSQDHPVLLFLAGPPGSGKSLYKNRMIDTSTYVQTDPDSLRQDLLPNYSGKRLADNFKTGEESLDVAQEILNEALNTKKNVVCESTLRKFDWAKNTIQEAARKGYRSELVFLHKPLAQCFTDAMDRGERPIPLSVLMNSIKGYDNMISLVNNGSFSSFQVIDYSTPNPVVVNSIATNTNVNQDANLKQIMNSLEPLRSLVSYE